MLFAGFAFTFRDLTQEWLGRKAVIVAILVGALLSWVVTSNRDLAVASAVAFLFSELADFASTSRCGSGAGCWRCSPPTWSAW